MPHVVVVVGTQWGDEGKGKIVDRLAETADLVVRFQGGANAGHTVLARGSKVVLHLIPSGALHPHTTCILGNGVVVDLEVLHQEIEDLAAAGVDIRKRLLISDRAHIVLPIHRALDAALERRRGEGRIATTQRGIGPTYTSKVARYGLRMIDLMDPDHLQARMSPVVDEANFLLAHLYGATPLDLKVMIRRIKELAGTFQPYISDVSRAINEAIDRGDRILLEGAQGGLLDVDFGTYPYVTSSNTIAGSACIGAGIAPTRIDLVLGVMKAYSTRIGAGPFPTEFPPAMAESFRKRAHEYGATTGRPRRCGWLDLVAVQHSIRLSGVTRLALTHLDVLAGMDRISICTAYERAGQTIHHIPTSTDIFSECHPVYEELAGWPHPSTGARSRSDLCRQEQEYVEHIEELTGTPCDIISMGPDREATLLPPTPFFY
jgi:adenylosuccinate synthase